MIDVRAGLLSPTLRSLRDIGFLDAVKKGQITFVVFHILGSSIASLNEIEDTAPFTADAEYFLVKNYINNTSFFEWDQATHATYFKKYQGRGRDHHPQAQRDGLSSRWSLLRFRSSPSSPTRERRAKRPIIRSCCAAMSATGSAMSGPSTIASSSTISSPAPPARERAASGARVQVVRSVVAARSSHMRRRPRAPARALLVSVGIGRVGLKHAAADAALHRRFAPPAGRQDADRPAVDRISSRRRPAARRLRSQSARAGAGRPFSPIWSGRWISPTPAGRWRCSTG